MYYPTFKRLVDLAGATFGLLIGAVPMAAVAGLIRYQMGSPVLYLSARPGLHGKPFVPLKFRTMDNRIDSNGKLLPDKERVTRLGRFLRRTSLDELPQLVNVLKGEMSLVGPRPLHVEYLPLYSAVQARRHDVKPGITGLAQINGRNALSWEERFRLDVLYTNNVTFLMDARILTQTALMVLRRNGVGADGDVDIPMFTGSPAGQSSAGG
jgi:sugar transferase EpsL